MSEGGGGIAREVRQAAGMWEVEEGGRDGWNERKGGRRRMGGRERKRGSTRGVGREGERKGGRVRVGSDTPETDKELEYVPGV